MTDELQKKMSTSIKVRGNTASAINVSSEVWGAARGCDGGYWKQQQYDNWLLKIFLKSV